MYRRLIIFGLAVCASALVAMLVPLTLSARDTVIASQLSEATSTARTLADDWRQRGGDHGEAPFPQPPFDSDGSVTFFGPKGDVEGPNPPQADRVVETALRGATTSEIIDGRGYVAAPAYFDDDDLGAVLVSLSPDELREGLLAQLALLAAVSLVLLSIAGGAAWWLARRTVAPLGDLEHTANAVAGGDLTARAPASSIAEIHHVGVALNRLTGRVQELLNEEREYTAELAHQLRTPLTVLSVDVDGVSDPEVRERLRDDLSAVHRMVDEIINTARRSTREGLLASCDVTEVVRGRVEFWQVLAEDQGRHFEQSIPTGPLPARLTAYDLTSALDILFQNVFLHTEEGVDFGVEVRRSSGFTDVTVWDGGPGFDVSERDADMVGSTRLGLSIARKVAEASGGDLRVQHSPTGGARVTLQLGPPAG